MKKKINIQLMGITALAILSTLALSTIVFYELFQRQIVEELKNYAHLLTLTVSSQNAVQQDIYEDILTADNIRVTKIDKGGKVVFDNHADISIMDNHENRPEVAEAVRTGEGKAIRKSATLGKSTFYYAVLMENGSVLRVAREADNLFSIMQNVLPIMIFITSALFLICIGLSQVLTKSLLEPIKKMAENLDEKDEIVTYEEMEPFIQTIRQQHEDIIKNSKVRQEFTANVSHELKTPLTAISGYSELIANHMVSEQDVARFAGEIHKSSNRLLTLINDIIRLSELDGDELEMSFEKVNLYALAQTCVDMLQMNAGKHEVTLSMEGRECYVRANRQMMEEVLYNLCDNAIRYNKKGGTVCVNVCPGIGGAVLEVKDTGIGIPKEHQERIFERFYRVDKSRSKSTGGTGLGLAIVKHIVAKHHALLSLDSEPGRGTTVTIEFPNRIS